MSNTTILTAAIDFGTTYSGYAYSFAAKKTDILMNTNWSSQYGMTSYKAPTCVLTRYTNSTNTHKFMEFGFKAQDRYANEGQDVSMCLFDTFKMKLHKIEEQGRRQGMKIWDKKGTISADATMIFAMALEYLKNHLMSHFQEIGKNIEMSYIRWVLTVPAIWSESAKAFMRKAALRAGLIDAEESDNLSIVLEPEAASLFCRKLDITHFERGSRCDAIEMKPGTVYMLLDAGGGTVDITVHEVLQNGNVKEVVAASGGAAGGTNVDAAFKEILRQSWGDNFIKTLKSESSRQWINIEQSFEKTKRNASPSSSSIFNLFSVSMAMDKKYKEATGDDMCKSFTNNRLGIIFNDDEYTVGITAATMAGIFKPTVDSILRCTVDVLRKVKRVKYIFMVGGFSSSQYLTTAVRRSFGDNVKVLIPEDPALAVLKGAVQFGWNRDFVRARIARKTYGAGCSLPFDKSIHMKEKKFTTDSGVRCKDIFSTYVEKNKSVELGSSVIQTFHAIYNDTTSCTLSIHSSDMQNPMYIDDEGTHELGTLTVESPDTSKGTDREYTLAFYFGETEIKATLKEKDVPGAVEKTTRIKFIAN